MVGRESRLLCAHGCELSTLVLSYRPVMATNKVCHYVKFLETRVQVTGVSTCRDHRTLGNYYGYDDSPQTVQMTGTMPSNNEET
jgi:hypothetical protein